MELCASADAGRAAGKVEEPDNRLQWAQTRSKCSRKLHLLVSLYLAMEDGTCVVERYHAHGTKISDSHKGPLSTSLFSDLLECKLDGPTSLEEVASRQGADLALTEFSRSFLKEWRKQYGSRFRIYKEKRVGKKEDEKSKMMKFTQAGLRLRQTMALHKLSAPDSAVSSSTVIPGVSTADAANHLRSQSMRPSQATSRFKRRTELIKEKAAAAKISRQTIGHPFGKPQRITAKLFTPQSTLQTPWVQKFKSLRRWKILDASFTDEDLVVGRTQYSSVILWYSH